MLPISATNDWRAAHPGAVIGLLELSGVDNSHPAPKLDEQKRATEARLRARYRGFARADFLSLPVMAAYQKYYKRFTKTYHVLLQLESIVLKGKSLPDVSPLVDAPENPVMVFFHGGGIAFGWNNPLRRELAYLAKFSGLRAFGVDYHLVPEYTYPVAHDECFTVYQTLLQQGKHIVLIGESSGGVLALATLLRAKSMGLPQPRLCVLISPLVDFGFKDARIWQVDDPFAHPKFTVEMHKHYVAGNDTTLPDLGPVYADLGGIAPLYVMAGEHEILRGEVDRLVEAARRCNVPMETIFWPNAWHSWHALAPQLPEATRAIETLGAAIRQRMSKYIQDAA